MAKSETADLLIGIVLHGETPEEREEYAQALIRKIMELGEENRLMDGVRGVQVKRGSVSYHSRSIRPLFKTIKER